MKFHRGFATFTLPFLCLSLALPGQAFADPSLEAKKQKVDLHLDNVRDNARTGRIMRGITLIAAGGVFGVLGATTSGTNPIDKSTSAV
ncbi:MAG TPA: hypothetical protein VL588_01715, partial [Bdellovibrionota bacterium]|nr:hypothetical protein [Bdellovibrionota bacterium]